MQQPETHHRPAAARTGYHRVLIVDDNFDSAETMAMLLELSDHETRTVHDGLAALDVAEDFRPDAVLLDINLPGLDGYEVCARLREQPWARGTLMVAVTGWGDRTGGDAAGSRRAGFDAHLVKPVEPQALENLLSSDSARARQPAESMGSRSSASSAS